MEAPRSTQGKGLVREIVAREVKGGINKCKFIPQPEYLHFLIHELFQTKRINLCLYRKNTGLRPYNVETVVPVRSPK